ncbi:MAG: GTPase Era [Erysipelotrichaceae bacterium]|nr:GTPase Era [Erysipelotrichaceae bacterium]
MEYRSGFIAIVGRPNAGKSTLLNALLKEKVAIISDKPNTTRNNIAGILTHADAQYVFMDTPGIHKPQQELGRVLNKNAYIAMEDCDCIAWIIDGSQSFGKGDQFILDRIRGLEKPVILLVNKIDKLSKEDLIRALLRWQQQYDFNEIIPISALNEENIQGVLHVLKNYLPQGPALFPQDMKSDHDLSFQLCEIVREKILRKTQEEIPHSVAVVLEEADGTHYRMMIVVDRQSQKGIIIGKQGAMIRKIRLDAQTEIAKKLGHKVELELYVRVEENWRNQKNKIKEFGMDEYNED